MIVNYTNKKITKLHEIIGDKLRETDKKTQYGLTSLSEVKACSGILYLRGALKLNTTDTDNVWYHESSHDIFAATMQRKRFTFLTRMIQFDDSDSRQERWREDHFTSFSKVSIVGSWKSGSPLRVAEQCTRVGYTIPSSNESNILSDFSKARVEENEKSYWNQRREWTTCETCETVFVYLFGTSLSLIFHPRKGFARMCLTVKYLVKKETPLKSRISWKYGLYIFLILFWVLMKSLKQI